MGQPDVLIEALKRYPFESVMSTINYLDSNFSKLKTELIPLALKKYCSYIRVSPFFLPIAIE